MFKFYEVRQYELDVLNQHRALKYDTHMHNEFEILYIVSGNQDISIMDTVYSLAAGDCALIFPNMAHSYMRPDNIPKNNHAAESTIIFAPSDMVYSMYPSTKNVHPEDCVVHLNDEQENAVLAFEKILTENSINAQIGWTFIILSYIVPEIMNRHINNSYENTSMISKVLSYITLNFHKSLTLDMISDELGISKYKLSRIFSDKIKMNFRTYLGMLRANYAASLIKVSDETLDVIAAKSGFESMRSFYRVFNQVYHISPALYRETIRKHII